VYQGETTQSLQDYLMWQVELTPFTDTDRAIATSSGSSSGISFCSSASRVSNASFS
jgi:hypothetical protein